MSTNPEFDTTNFTDELTALRHRLMETDLTALGSADYRAFHRQLKAIGRI